jgi:hypothetical protein
MREQYIKSGYLVLSHSFLLAGLVVSGCDLRIRRALRAEGWQKLARLRHVRYQVERWGVYPERRLSRHTSMWRRKRNRYNAEMC